MFKDPTDMDITKYCTTCGGSDADCSDYASQPHYVVNADLTPPLQPDEDYKEIAEIIYGVEEAEKLIKAKAHLPQVEAVFKVLEAREQAARIDELRLEQSIKYSVRRERRIIELKGRA